MKLPKKEFIELSYKDTLIVDSLSFIQLKDYIVIPQYRIDSIYENEGVKGLLSAYFDDVWFIPSCEDGILTLPEQRYVIDILHRCGYCVDIDCNQVAFILYLLLYRLITSRKISLITILTSDMLYLVC